MSKVSDSNYLENGNNVVKEKPRSKGSRCCKCFVVLIGLVVGISLIGFAGYFTKKYYIDEHFKAAESNSVLDEVVTPKVKEDDISFLGKVGPSISVVNLPMSGSVWPLPAKLKYFHTNRTLSVDAIDFTFTAGKNSNSTCDIYNFVKDMYTKRWFFPKKNSIKSTGTLTIDIQVENDCPSIVEYPQHGMNEEYIINIPLNSNGVIEAKEIWGVVRAFETLSQLIYRVDDMYYIRTANIEDFPEYSIRGVLLDTGRHYLSKDVILRQIDVMAQNKLNFLHWHIVDMEFFPYVSMLYPNLTKFGASSINHIYTPSAIREIIRYARNFGIRVMVEFDTSGHMGSWAGQKNLLAKCRDNKIGGALFDVSLDENYVFLRKFLEEVFDLFPEQFIHLGGDEISEWVDKCWDSNDEIKEFMKRQNYSNVYQLMDYHISKVEGILHDLKSKGNNRRLVFWQEVYTNHPSKDAILHLWIRKTDTLEISQITSAGYNVIFSSCWYLDNIVSNKPDWRAEDNRFYYCNPRDFEGSAEQKARVLGGIAALWAEYIDGTNLEARLWPYGSVVAERLWSLPQLTKSAEEAWPRLHEHRCRMIERGFRARPINGPDACDIEWTDRHYYPHDEF